MRPSKTDLARDTLQAHDGTLGMRERRALILCDGQRGLDDLVPLLGQDAPLLIQRLVRDGYLTGSPSPAAVVAEISPPLMGYKAGRQTFERAQARLLKP